MHDSSKSRPAADALTPVSPGAYAARWFAGSRGLLALAIVVGLGAGVGAIAFRYLILGLTEVFTGHGDYSAAGRVGNPHLPGLGMWFVVLAPVLGGLLYGPLISRFAPEARGHGVAEVMLAVSENGGRIRPQVPAVKSLASALCIGSGGSVGREGPIVQIGSALGSLVGQATKLPERSVRILVACGAAGGISATFNAPIAGVFFALEVILRDFEAESFGAVVLSSVTANALSRAVFGNASFLHLPSFALVSPAEFVLYAVLGAVAGVIGIVFVRVLYGTEDLADRLWRGPAWARPAVGGVLLGGLLLLVPEMYGVGYPVLSGAVEGHYAVAVVCGLLVAKLVAASLTIAIGGSGGVFAPSLFIGAMLGSGFGQLVHGAAPGMTAPSGAYALVGMGAVFAGAARAPITAVIILFELTGEYRIILPLMVAIVLATAVSHHLSADSIYTLKLRRRGITLKRPNLPSEMRTISVSAAMSPAPRPLPADASLADVVARLAGERDPTVPVLSEQGRLIGVINAADIEVAMLAEGPRTPVASDLAHVTREVRATDVLEDAVHALAHTEDSGLPVLDRDGLELAGWVTHRDILHAYHGTLEPPADPASRRPQDVSRSALQTTITAGEHAAS